MRIYFRDILLISISRGANNCGQHSLEKNIYFIMRFSPHSQLFYFNDRLEFCEFFEWKIKRINNADLFSHTPFLTFIKGANISGGHCTLLIYFIYLKYDLLAMLKTWYFFQDSLMNKKLNKNSIYLKYNLCNNIHYRSKAWGQYFNVFFKKLVFIQQGLVKLIETVIIKIDIVRKHLYFE